MKPGDCFSNLPRVLKMETPNQTLAPHLKGSLSAEALLLEHQGSRGIGHNCHSKSDFKTRKSPRNHKDQELEILVTWIFQPCVCEPLRLPNPSDCLSVSGGSLLF